MSPLQPAMCMERHRPMEHSIDDVEHRLEALEGKPDPELLLPELTALRSEVARAHEIAESTRAVVTTLTNDFAALRIDVQRISSHLEESSQEQIVALRAALQQTMRDQVEESRDTRADRRKFRYSLVLAVVGAIATCVGATVGRASAPGGWHCSRSAAVGK